MRTAFAVDAFVDRVALVTGAASGIGGETAALLAGLGATVWATDRDADGLARMKAAHPGDILTVEQDVSNLEGWRGLTKTIAGKSGRLDILVNNAGIMLTKGLLEITPQEWAHQQHVNVDSVFFGMQSSIPLMLQTVQTHGTHPSIINISSVFGIVSDMGCAAYSASKGAVRALTKAAAIEFAAKGLRVNSVHPGPTLTNLAKDAPRPVHADGTPLSDEEIYMSWVSRIPAGRPGAAAEMAQAIAFLASDASIYMTGTELVVDGGYTMI